ncbi:MAG: MFS transporter, partial [Thermoplasmatota archaeon]
MAAGRPFSGLDARVFVVAAGTLLLIAARSAVFPFLTLYVTHGCAACAISVAWAAVALFVESFVKAFASPFGGAFSDRWGRRNSLVLGPAIAALVFPLLLFVHTPVALVAWAALVGFAESLYWPASNALISELVAPRDRTRAFAINHTANNVGYTLIVVPAGFFAAAHFTLLVVGAALLYVLLSVLIATAIAEPGVAPNAASLKRANPLAAATAATRDPPFVLFLALFAGFPLAIGVLANVIPGYVVDGLGFDQRVVGALLGLNGLIVILLAIPLSNTLAKRDPLALLPALDALLVGSFVLCGLARTFPARAPLLLTIAVVLLSAAESVFTAATPAAVAALAPAANRGAYQGAFSMVIALGIGLALAIAAAARTLAGWSGAWMVLAGIELVACIGFLLARETLAHASEARR